MERPPRGNTGAGLRGLFNVGVEVDKDLQVLGHVVRQQWFLGFYDLAIPVCNVCQYPYPLNEWQSYVATHVATF